MKAWKNNDNDESIKNTWLLDKERNDFIEKKTEDG